MKRYAEHFGVKIYGISGQILVRPAPVRCLEEKAVIIHDFPVAVDTIINGEAPPPEKRGQCDHSGGTDLFA